MHSSLCINRTGNSGEERFRRRSDSDIERWNTNDSEAIHTRNNSPKENTETTGVLNWYQHKHRATARQS